MAWGQNEYLSFPEDRRCFGNQLWQQTHPPFLRPCHPSVILQCQNYWSWWWLWHQSGQFSATHYNINLKKKEIWLHCICVYFYFLNYFVGGILWTHTCCLLNAAIYVGDGSFARVKRYRWINEGALVAYTADDQAAWNIFKLSGEHCMRSLTWTLKGRLKMSKNKCKTCGAKDIWSASEGNFVWTRAVSGNTTASTDALVLFHNATLCFS